MQISFVERAPEAGSAAAKGRILLVCPWLEGLDRASGIWIAALPIHDLNAFLETAPALPKPSEPTGCYHGIFALDRFRSQAHLFSLLRSRGIRRIINLPSVSFFDGRSASAFQSLNLGSEQEMGMLRAAREAGFDVAFCTRRPVDWRQVGEGVFDFVLSHEGPGSEFRVERPPAVG
jgi:predicted TIM-barrel enzyme